MGSDLILLWQGYFVNTVIRTLLEWADRFLSKLLGDGWVDRSGWIDTPEVEFVSAVSAGGSVKFLPAV